MARPINANAQETRDRILETASRLFSEHGVGETSIRKIARESEVSLAMVHHYYGSKSDLYQACIAAMYTELLEMKSEIIEAITQGQSPQQLIAESIRAGFRFARAHQAAIRLMQRHIIDTG